MLRRKVAESLTARIFLMTALILLLAGAMTFSLIAWATPSTYTAVVSDDLARQVDALVEELANTALRECGPVLEKISPRLRRAGHAGGAGRADRGHGAVGRRGAGGCGRKRGHLLYPKHGGGHGERHRLRAGRTRRRGALCRPTRALCPYVTPRVEAENLAVRALAQMAPWLLLTLLAFSLICALIYSRTITRPIVRLSGIAEKMARLDLGWTCKERRRDEIGAWGAVWTRWQSASPPPSGS